MDHKQATTTTQKYNNADCTRCSHYWLRPGYETCTNSKMVDVYWGKRMKVGSMIVCDYYEPIEEE